MNEQAIRHEANYLAILSDKLADDLRALVATFSEVAESAHRLAAALPAEDKLSVEDERHVKQVLIDHISKLRYRGKRER